MPHDDLPSDYGAQHVKGASRKSRKRPITVRVSGERGSGKTTLIAIVAQALEGAGHLVKKDRFVPNATRATAELREQFDVTFVEQYDSEGDLAGENANLRATIAELQGKVAGLSGERSRIAAANQRLVEVDETLRAENQRLRQQNADGTTYAANLLGEIERLKRELESAGRPVSTERALIEIDRAFEEVRQAAYIEAERNRLRTEADALKTRARKLGQEGDARLISARRRMLFALVGPHGDRPLPHEASQLVMDRPEDEARDPYLERADTNPFSSAYKRRALTLLEQSAAIADGATAEDAGVAVYDSADAREDAATDKLLAANIALMGGDDPFHSDSGC